MLSNMIIYDNICIDTMLYGHQVCVQNLLYIYLHDTSNRYIENVPSSHEVKIGNTIGTSFEKTLL